MADRATIDDAIYNGIDLSTNAFMLVHGWTAGPVLLEFVEKFREPLLDQPMTAAQLAEATGAEEGPLAIVLRACCVLKYVSFDPESGEYSLAKGVEMDELVKFMGPNSAAAKGLRSLYVDSTPPFAFPSDEAARYLRLWEDQRPLWNKSKSKVLSILMDGMVLAPLLTSITYFARWDEEGQEHGRENALDRFDFGNMDPGQRTALGDIFEQVGVGTMNAKGVVMMSAKGSMALQRCYSYYVPVSYAPMLAQLPQILFDDPGWGFEEGSDAFEMEEHVDRILNVVGGGAQHRTLFKDLMRHIELVFRGDSFETQPQFIVDVGCGDGSLLIHIYDYVKYNTPRGKVLAEHPLTMVGVDLNEDPRVTTAVNLSKQGIPHVVIGGDIGKPAEIMASLKKKKVDPAKTLHVRSFLDHDRTYVKPKMKIEEGSAMAMFALQQFRDIVHIDVDASRISSLDMFANLVEHFNRWAEVSEVSFGICLLEVMMLDIPTTKRFFCDNVSFPLDLVQCLSRQYLCSAVAFAMAAGMTGLFPANYSLVDTYPDQAKYYRMLGQHLVKKPYKVRFAEPSDIQSLMQLEELAWAENLRASAEVIGRRVSTAPTSNLVAEIGGDIVAVLYMQRIENLAILDQECFMDVSNVHSPKGRLLQLISIAAHPELASMNVGSELKQFALHLARLDSSVDQVVAVTRCLAFADSGVDDMARYVDEHFVGKRDDGTLGFHSDAGAKFVRLVEGYRPEDTANRGVGVLVQYDVKRSYPKMAQRGQGVMANKKMASLDILQNIMTDLGYPPDLGDLTRSFFDYGMDSVELVRIRNKLTHQLDLDLPATLLLDFPTVHDLAMQLDRDRRAVEDRREVKEEPSTTSGPSQLLIDHGVGGGRDREKPRASPKWDTIGVAELLEMQRRAIEVFAQRTLQKRFSASAKSCFPDMLKYVISIEHILVEVEGPIFLDYGLIDDLEYQSVQTCRENMTAHLLKFWLSHTELRLNATKLLRLTLQDQQWGEQ